MQTILENTMKANINIAKTNIEGLSIDEAITKAGFDYTIETQPLQYIHNGEVIVDKKKQVLTHSKTGHCFNVPSDRYKIKHTQPAAILEFYRDLADKNDLKLKTAGVLKQGASVYAIAEFPDSGMAKSLVKVGDTISNNIILSTSCDGSSSTKARHYIERLVCLNGMTAKTTKSIIKVPHSTHFNADKVKLELGLVQESWLSFNEAMEQLVNTKLEYTSQLKLIHMLVGKEKEADKESTKTQNIMNSIYDLSKTSAGSSYSTTHNTAWGLLNGFTYYVDHVAGRSEDTRINSALFGDGARLKIDAMELLKQVADIEEANKGIQVYENNDAQDLLNMPR